VNDLSLQVAGQVSAASTASGLSTAKLAKIVREGKELRAENAQQTATIQALEAEVAALRDDNKKIGGVVSAVQEAAATTDSSSAEGANAMQLLATATADAAAATEKQKEIESRMW
jgi:hypothetical protein